MFPLSLNSAGKRLLALAVMFLFLVSGVQAADWHTLTLTGTFGDAQEDATEGVLDSDPDGQPLMKGYARGTGMTSYSLATAEPVDDNAGDLILLVGFTNHKATSANFSLAGEHLVDLGPSIPPAAKLKMPKKNWFSHPYTGPRKMVIGNYYYLVRGGQHVIVQPTAFHVSNVQVNDTMPGAFGYTIHSADCTLKANYISASTLDGLKQLIDQLPASKVTP
jgi:hypothetical protein